MPSSRMVPVACLLSLALLAFCAAPAPAQRQSLQDVEWNKIECANAHLLPPAGMNVNCFDGSFEKVQGPYDCRLNNAAVGAPAEGGEPHFYARARYPRAGSQSCVTMGFPNAAEALQHFHRFLAQAASWSDLQTPRDDIQLRFFDAKTKARDGRCFSFVRYGPPQTRGKGYQFTMVGFFCKPPGQPLDAAMAVAAIDALQMKP